MKHGEVIVDQHGEVHRREWETPDETPADIMARFQRAFRDPSVMRGSNTLIMRPEAYEALRRFANGGVVKRDKPYIVGE